MSQRFLLSTAARSLRVQPSSSSSLVASKAFSAARVVAARPSPILKAATSAQAPYVKGTVNDATTFPSPSKTHGSYHWTFERLTSVALIPMLAATAVTSTNPILDGILSVSIVLHSHIGFDSILTDYLHERKFPLLGPICKWTVRFLTTGTLYGLYEFNTNDIGITELVKRTWTA